MERTALGMFSIAIYSSGMLLLHVPLTWGGVGINVAIGSFFLIAHAFRKET